MVKERTLESLRSKLLADRDSERAKSNSNGAVENVVEPAAAAAETAKREGPISGERIVNKRTKRDVSLPKGPRHNVQQNTAQYRSRYSGITSRYNTGNNGGYRYDNGYQYHDNGGRYQRNNTHVKRFSAEDLKDVIPIEKRPRMRPTKWDTTPEGFEKVAAERAKLSGLFPQPGEPRELDRYKLSKVAKYNGQKSRRTQILFENEEDSKLMFSRWSCKLIVKGDAVMSSEFLSNLQTIVSKILLGLDGNYKLLTAQVIPEQKASYLELNNAPATTLLLSMRSFCNNLLNQPGLLWERPKEYIQQTDNPEILCNPEIVALEKLDTSIPGTEDSIKQLCIAHNIDPTFIKPIWYKDENESIFTRCALIELPKGREAELLGTLTYFQPNKSHLSQTVSSITFQKLPQLVTEPSHPESKVLLLLNCVDPLDLKNTKFADEVTETLRSTLEDVQDIKVKRPSADYRLNFEHIGEGAGNIFVKFNSIAAAKNAMQKLPGSKFNDRTILCAYIDESEFSCL